MFFKVRVVEDNTEYQHDDIIYEGHRSLTLPPCRRSRLNQKTISRAASQKASSMDCTRLLKVEARAEVGG